MSELIYPVCIGMERSGSTVVWQIASLVLKNRLEKTHDYVDGTCDCIYTYRDPIACYISLRRVFLDVYPRGIAENHAIRRLYSHAQYYKNLLRDKRRGRRVLFLKYEDFYNMQEERIIYISRFLNKKLSAEEVKKILNQTSIEENLKKSNNRNFGIVDKDSNLHGFHINPVTLGNPESSLSKKENYTQIAEIKSDPRMVELRKIFCYY